jgi:hypothetical protein
MDIHPQGESANRLDLGAISSQDVFNSPEKT